MGTVPKYFRFCRVGKTHRPNQMVVFNFISSEKFLLLRHFTLLNDTGNFARRFKTCLAFMLQEIKFYKLYCLVLKLQIVFWTAAPSNHVLPLIFTVITKKYILNSIIKLRFLIINCNFFLRARNKNLYDSTIQWLSIAVHLYFSKKEVYFYVDTFIKLIECYSINMSSKKNWARKQFMFLKCILLHALKNETLFNILQ